MGQNLSIFEMFSKLEAQHIIERVLNYFGNKSEFGNVHWIRWKDLPKLLEMDERTLTMEMESAALRTPRFMSLHEINPMDFLLTLREELTPELINQLIKNKFFTKNTHQKSSLCVCVMPFDGLNPLGLLYFEKCPRGEPEKLVPQILETLRLMVRFIEFGLIFWDSKNLTMMDDLTELYNQRFLPLVLENEISRSKRKNQSFCCLFMDLDYFKKINDTKGHWIGSKLLTEVGQLLKSSIRSCDFGFRYGGDEFVVVLPYTDINGGQVVAERIRKTIEETCFMIDGHQVQLTISIGLAAYPLHASTKEEIIQLADHAMYFGKRKCRNIVYVANS
ncbi:MAG: GGDEF domain-containing protein [Bdellovibrionales bacterium]|nr:GGDEF domain-containing protein [Bdellovibrionales bacterium]